jgi:hypothetical protein
MESTESREASWDEFERMRRLSRAIRRTRSTNVVVAHDGWGSIPDVSEAGNAVIPTDFDGNVEHRSKDVDTHAGITRAGRRMLSDKVIRWIDRKT